MGRHTANLFPNAQRAQHYGTPPPEAESTGRVSWVATAMLDAKPLIEAAAAPEPEPPAVVRRPNGKVIPRPTEAPAMPDPRDGPEWSDAPTDLRVVRGELPIDPSSVWRGWRGWRTPVAQVESPVPGPLETEDHTR